MQQLALGEADGISADPISLDAISRNHSLLPTASIKMPAVAAIVCNYNQKDYLQDSIASMLGQTYPHMQFVIVDDCSTDGSREVIENILSRIGEGRVRFIRHEENRGQMAAMLSGLDATTAPFVAWLDADDIWLPHYIERHIAHHLNSQVNAAISTSNMFVIDASSTLIAGADPSMSISSPLRTSTRTFPMQPTVLLQHGKGICFSTEHPQGPLLINRRYEPWIWSPTSGMVFRRSAVDIIRPSDSGGLRTCADHYVARFTHVVGGTIWMRETLGCYRVHGNNEFAKRTVYGDGPLGTELKPITNEGNYQFALKCLKSEQLRSILAKADLKRLLRKIGRDRRTLRVILANRELIRKLPLTWRLFLCLRYLAKGPQRPIQSSGHERF